MWCCSFIKDINTKDLLNCKLSILSPYQDIYSKAMAYSLFIYLFSFALLLLYNGCVVCVCVCVCVVYVPLWHEINQTTFCSLVFYHTFSDKPSFPSSLPLHTQTAGTKSPIFKKQCLFFSVFLQCTVGWSVEIFFYRTEQVK